MKMETITGICTYWHKTYLAEKKSGELAQRINSYFGKILVLIFVGLLASLAAIFSYRPKQHFLSCDRPCHDLDWPMICRIKLTLEVYHTMTRSCGECPSNTTQCGNMYCITGDGALRPVISANRQLPGPNIQVCQNDVLVVDVVNRIPGQSVTLHWRGQPQHEAPSMDGVPLVTQCPIQTYTTFQYKFRASSAGTHYWHAYGNAETSDGLFGALIVRQADKYEPHRKLYDVDSRDHVIVISEWSHKLAIKSFIEKEFEKADSLVVNGRGIDDSGDIPLKEFDVIPKKRYRFRVIYTGGIFNCPIHLMIDEHVLKVIALDGNPITPKDVTSITFNKGERVDFVLTANHHVNSYFLRVSTTDCNSANVQGAAVIRYKGSSTDSVNIDSSISSDLESNEIPLKEKKFNTKMCYSDLSEVCIESVQSLREMPDELKFFNTQTQLFLPFGFKTVSGVLTGKVKVPHFNNLTFVFPSSPLLSQAEDVPASEWCSQNSYPIRCKEQSDIPCECVHVEKIPLGDTVEIILIDQGGDRENLFHLHGYSFWIVGTKLFETSIDLNTIKDLNRNGKLFERNLFNPVRKDTITIPRYGAVALRFKADNPGFWMLKDEHARQWTRGLDVILQIGERSQHLAPPTDFPKCGNWVGPEFFLA